MRLTLVLAIGLVSVVCAAVLFAVAVDEGGHRGGLARITGLVAVSASGVFDFPHGMPSGV